MLAFGKSRSGAGGSDGFVNDLGVTERINNRLRNEGFVANGAMLALGQTRLGTSGSNGLINCFGVTERFNNRLRNEGFMADRAVLSFSQTCGGAGGSNGFVDRFGMTECFCQFGITNSAFLCFRAGRFRARVVSFCGDRLSFFFAAFTNALLKSFCRTGCFAYGCPLAPRVFVSA